MHVILTDWPPVLVTEVMLTYYQCIFYHIEIVCIGLLEFKCVRLYMIYYVRVIRCKATIFSWCHRL